MPRMALCLASPRSTYIGLRICLPWKLRSQKNLPMIWMGCPLADDNLRPWSGGASSMAQCPGMDLYFSSEMQEIADPVSTRKTVSEPSMVPERCGLVSMTSGDALSRPPQPLCSILDTDHSFNFKELIKAQKSDPILKSVAKSDPLPSPLVSTRRGICHEDGRLFIPSSFVKNILFASHDKSGHFSAPYVKRTINRSCYWPSMSQDIANYIASCDICARVNPCLLYTSPSPRDKRQSRMPSSA